MSFQRSRALLGVSALLLGTITTVAGADPIVGTSPSVSAAKSAADSLSAQARAIATRLADTKEQLANAQAQDQVDGERYDEATVALQIAQTKTAQLKRKLVVEQRRVVRAKKQVQKSAVESYVVGSGAAAQFGAILSGTVGEAQTVNTYAGAATSSLQQAVHTLQGDEADLQQSEAAEQHSVLEESLAVTNARAAQASHAALADQEATLQQNESAALANVNSRKEVAYANLQVAIEQQKQEREQAAAERHAEVRTTTNGIGPPQVGSSGPSLTPAGTNDAGSAALTTAESMLGIPYVWGGASSSGVDCSGLTMLAWGAAGVPLLHSAYYQDTESTPVSLSALEPGDLLFYWYPNDGTTDPVSHVAMYVGSGPYGGNTIIQAPETGEDVMFAPMYYNGFVGAGRP